MDGILNNDAFKHVGNERNNETWTRLLHELQFFGDTDENTMYMRRRFVLGAAEWMAGRNGSKQNDKELLEYTDTQWEYIWMTMLEDGAWAVPGIKDSQGNVIKENDAPEILIKYIAHDLKCHIIVFDLSLNRIQFLSGNHLKNDNVIFDSPLLLYTTGGHFQAVFQEDHDFFEKYAKELDSENDLPIPMPLVTDNRQNQNVQNSVHFAKELNAGNDTLEISDSQNQTSPAPAHASTSIQEEAIIEENFDIHVGLEIEPTLEFLKSIKASKRTPEQKKIMEKLRKKKQRETETETSRNLRKLRDQENTSIARENETKQERTTRQTKDNKQKAQKRKGETPEQTQTRNERSKNSVKEKRLKETPEETLARNAKNKERMKQDRLNENPEERLTRNTKDMERKEQDRLNEILEETLAIGIPRIWKE